MLWQEPWRKGFNFEFTRHDDFDPSNSKWIYDSVRPSALSSSLGNSSASIKLSLKYNTLTEAKDWFHLVHHQHDYITKNDGVLIDFTGYSGELDLTGGLKGDMLAGGYNADIIDGGDGDDFIEGGPRSDTLVGGNGNDTFSFGPKDSGLDVIEDFSPGDRIIISGDYEAKLDGKLITSTLSYGMLSLGDVAIELQGPMRGKTWAAKYDPVNESTELKIALSPAAVVLNDDGGFDITIFSPEQLSAGMGTTGVDHIFYAGSSSVRLASNIEDLTLTDGDSSARGNSRDNVLTGSKGDNRLQGDGGDDVIYGGAGNDTLYGGNGNDVLRGGAGKDTFVFNSKLGTFTTDRLVNFDTIIDFNVKSDSFWLDNRFFKKLGKGTEYTPGKLDQEFFTIGTKAKDKDDYLIYNKSTGVLSYDADGSAKGKAVEIAALSKNLKLTEKDFFVI